MVRPADDSVDLAAGLHAAVLRAVLDLVLADQEVSEIHLDPVRADRAGLVDRADSAAHLPWQKTMTNDPIQRTDHVVLVLTTNRTNRVPMHAVATHAVLRHEVVHRLLRAMS